MKGLKIVFNPTNKNIEDIESWGFEKAALYYSFRNKSLIIAEYNNETIGFYCLRIEKNDLAIKIETAEIKEEYRKRGIGKITFLEILKKYKTRKHYSFTLYCSPEESQFYWQKLGFEYFPENQDSDKVEMFKHIKDINEEIEVLENYPNTIEIFGDNSKNYKWKFTLNDNTNKLNQPIIFFGNYNWRMVLKINGKVLYDGEYRYFDGSNKIDSCIFIESIPKKYLNFF